MIKQILKSLSLTVLISGVITALTIGLVPLFIAEIPLIALGSGVFGLSLVFQFVIAYYVGAARETGTAAIQQIALEYATNYQETIAEMATPVTLSCAYCNIQNQVAVSLLKSNGFTCNSCNQLNKVFIQLQTTRVTQPLIGEAVDLKEIALDEEDQVRQTTINEKVEIT